MSNASNLSTLANVLDDANAGEFLKSTGSGGVAFDTVAAGAVVYATADLLPLSGFAAGDMAYVTATNRFYINNGSGWYSISLVNTNPNITSVADAGSNTTPFTLATDQTATVITITAADPEEVPLTYSYSVTSGSLNGCTITGADGTSARVAGTAYTDNVFTVTPHASQDATFTITFTASDGINQATSANAFSLLFVTVVTDSNHTTLLASVASNSPYSFPSANNQVSSFSVNSQTSSPTEVVFGDSGTKMFVLSSDRYVYSYNLSTAYDASTASYVATSSELTQFTTNTSESFRFKPDGTVMFVSGSNGYVYQYSLSTAWDVSTIAYASKSVQHPNSNHSYKALTFKPDGTRIYMAGLRYVMSMTLSSPWDLANPTPDNTSNGFTDNVLNLGWVYGHTITGMDFNSTGTSLTMVYGNNSSDKYIMEHPIDDAWNVSNATALGSAPSTTYQQNTIQGLAYANDGKTLVTVLDNGDTVYTYDTGMSGINNNIADSSSNNHSITVTGDAHAGTFSPYRSGNYSLGFSGNSYITLSNSSTFELTGDFCIDGFWYLPTTNSGTIFELGQYQNGILFGPDQYDNGIYVNGSKLTGLASSVTIETWQHFAIVRKGSGSNNLKLYVDGTKVAESTVTANINSNYSSYTNIRIGSATHTYGSGSDLDDGSYIRDLRIVKGDSVYPSSSDSVPPNSITVPTEKSTAITGTILFAGALPYLADASTTDSTFTATNAVSTKPFSPYDYTEYSATDHGGSVYFDGNTDTIHTASTHNFANNGFSVSFWYYATLAQGVLFASASNHIGTLYFSGSLSYSEIRYEYKNSSGSNTTLIGNNAPKPKYFSWNYLQIVQDSNGHIRIYSNGTQIGSTVTNAAMSGASSTAVTLGDWGSSGSSTGFQGYISDFNLTTETSPSTAVPIAPRSSTSNTKLLISGTDASIIDKSQGANLKLEGDITGSTTQAKFSNTKSMSFDSVDDLINLNGVLDLSQACTWEAWVYFDNHPTASGFMHMFQSASYSSTDPPFGIRFKTTGGRKVNFVLYTTSSNHEVQSSNAVNLDTWHHLAFSRTSSGVYSVYINGIRYATFTESATYQSSGDVMVIGNSGTGSTSARFLDGYMQDIRITQGLARYTAADESANIPSAPLEG